jgi:anti-anti-sigma regulatory factor
LIDLAETSYISSAGLRALTQIYNLLRDKSGEGQESVGPGLRDGTYRSQHLKLLDPTPQVQRVLAAAGYDMFLESHTDHRQAVDSF